MLNFKKIEFENFLSFYGHHEYNFAQQGIHWIRGINWDSAEKDPENPPEQHSVGAGKSSFTFGIQYALFGEIEKGVARDRVINKEAGKGLYVCLEFAVDNSTYRIRRYRKHDEYANKLIFEIKTDEGWNDSLTTTDSKETQRNINSIIVVNAETFLKSILFSREDDNQFFKLTNSERVKIFENIIQLNKFEKYLKRAKKKLKEAEDELQVLEREEMASKKAIKIHQQNAEEERQHLDEKKAKIEQKISKLKKDLEKLKDIPTNIIKILEKYNSLQAKIDSINKHHKTLTDMISKYENEISKHEDIISDRDMKIKDLQKKVMHLKKEIEQYENLPKNIVSLLEKYKTIEDKIKSIEYQQTNISKTISLHRKTIDDANASITKNKNLIAKAEEKMQAIKEVKCWQCGAVQNESEVKSMRNHYQEQIASLMELNTEHQETIKKFISEIQKLEKEVEDAEKQKKAFLNEQHALGLTEDQLELDINELEGLEQKKDEIKDMLKEIKTLKANKFNEEAITELRKEIEKVQTDVEKLDAEINMLTKQQQDLGIKEEYLKLDEDELNAGERINEELKELQTELRGIDYSNVEKYQKEAQKEHKRLNEIDANKKTFAQQKSMSEWWVMALDMKADNSIKSHIMAKMIPVFNKILQENLDVAFDNTVQITIDQYLNEYILKNGIDYEYKEFSTGEKLKINLITNLSIFDLTRINLSGSSLIFMDEIFNNVDAPTVKKFLKIIEEKYAINTATYLISHIKTVEENIKPETITIIDKHNDRSTIKIV